MNAFWELFFLYRDVGHYRIRNFDCVVTADAKNLNHHGLFAIELGVLINVLETVNNIRNISEQEPRPSGFSSNDDVLEFLTTVALPSAPKSYLSCLGLYRPSWNIDARRTDGLCDLRECQLMTP